MNLAINPLRYINERKNKEREIDKDMNKYTQMKTKRVRERGLNPLRNSKQKLMSF